MLCQIPSLQESLVAFHRYFLDPGGVYGNTLNPNDVMAHVLISKKCLSAVTHPCGTRFCISGSGFHQRPALRTTSLSLTRRKASFLMQRIRMPQRDTCCQAALNILPRDPGKRKQPYSNMPKPDHIHTGEEELGFDNYAGAFNRTRYRCKCFRVGVHFWSRWKGGKGGRESSRSRAYP